MPARIQFDREKLAEFCRRNHIKRLSFFGSVLRDDFSADSDIDLLYELKDGCAIGYFKLVEMELELSSFFGGRKVDLVSPAYLKPAIKEDILNSAEVEYAQI